MWILSFDHVFTSHNIFVNSKRTYTSTRDSQGTPTDYIFQIEGLTQMHDYDDDLLYKNVILLTTCIFYWHMMKVGLEAPLYRGAGRKNLRGGGEVLFVSAPFRSVIFTAPPSKYIVRFNPPLFQSRRRGGVISAAYTSPPLSCAPAFLKNLGLYPRFFLWNHWYIWYFEI